MFGWDDATRCSAKRSGHYWLRRRGAYTEVLYHPPLDCDPSSSSPFRVVLRRRRHLPAIPGSSRSSFLSDRKSSLRASDQYFHQPRVPQKAGKTVLPQATNDYIKYYLSIMEQPLHLSDYLFSKMVDQTSTPDSNSSSITNRNSNCDSIRRIRRWFKENMLLLVTVSGVFFGVVLVPFKQASAAGSILGTSTWVSLRPLELSPDSILLISYPGELFMRLLKLMILPLVIASLIAGSASLNARMNGKIALRTMAYFLLTSLFNAALGILLVVAIHPGDPETKRVLGAGTENREVNILDGFLDLGRNIFPDNLFQAAFQQAHTVYVERRVMVHNDTTNDTSTTTATSHNGPDNMEAMVHAGVELVRDVQYREGTNTLGIIFFCLVFGTVLGTLGRRARVVIEFFSAVDEVIMKMVTGVMWLTPIGVSSVIAGKILCVNNLGLVMSQLAWFIFTVVLGVLLYQLVFMQLIYLLVVGRNPFHFYCGLVQATLTAFATASTAAALPVTFRCMDQKVKVDPRISRFILPIGATVNMDGTALFVSIASIFIAQINEIPLSMGEYVTICLTSTAASIASASVPSAALVLMLIVLTAIDAPVQDVSLLFAVDWFVDRVRTTNNMLGDCYAAAVVEHLSRDELKATSPRPSGEHGKDEHVGNGHVGNGHLLPMSLGDLKNNDREPEVMVLEVTLMDTLK
ncbi:hypothetical protein B566_EDAN017521 [Ephemera danica]|nr:hypothetical protein B566_EDAN017521 [Ephemera danica]